MRVPPPMRPPQGQARAGVVRDRGVRLRLETIKCSNHLIKELGAPWCTD